MSPEHFRGPTARTKSPWLHAHLGIVPQQNHLFAGTIYENIRIVKPGATREDVRTALAKLDCLETIESIPELYGSCDIS